MNATFNAALSSLQEATNEKSLKSALDNVLKIIRRAFVFRDEYEKVFNQRAQGPKISDLLIKAFLDRDETIEILRFRREPGLVEKLIAYAHEQSDPSEIISIAMILEEHWDNPKATTILKQFAEEHGDADVQLNATDCLMQHANLATGEAQEEALQTVLKSPKSQDVKIRRMFAETCSDSTLTDKFKEKVKTSLINLAMDSDEITRNFAIEALGHSNHEGDDVAEALLKFIEDKSSPNISDEALEGFTKFNSAVLIKRTLKIIEDNPSNYDFYINLISSCKNEEIEKAMRRSIESRGWKHVIFLAEVCSYKEKSVETLKIWERQSELVKPRREDERRTHVRLFPYTEKSESATINAA